MRSVSTAVVLGSAALAGLLFARKAGATVTPANIDRLAADPSTALSTWQPPAAAATWMPYIRQAEQLYSIPENLLARLLYQESHFRDDIISGQVISPAGAVGIAQIIPRWHPTVDPTDPVESIYYAGEYLADLYDQFGSWQLALAAYNWGPGNLKEWQLGLQNMPSETANYISEILADVVVA